jgi:cytidine deaminase
MKIFRKGKLSKAEIIQWLREIRANAYIPESGYAVAAVFRARVAGVDDYYFAGVNVENAEHRLSTHGEEGAIAAMVTGLGKRAEIAEGWVMGAPKDAPRTHGSSGSCCGKCRQQIAGFAAADVKIHSVALNGKVTTTTVGKFLPDVFTFREYIKDIGKAKKSAAPTEAEIRKKLVRTGNLTEGEISAWLKTIESVDYASKKPQALVLQLDNGAYVAGAKVEEAAFNGMSAAQTALAIAVSEFGIRKVKGTWIPAAQKKQALPTLQVLSAAVGDDRVPIRFV